MKNKYTFKINRKYINRISISTYKQLDNKEILMIYDKDFATYKLSKEAIDIKYRNSLNVSSQKSKKIKIFDDTWYLVYNILYFQNVSGAAIDKLVESQSTASVYIKEYKLLIISDRGLIIGQISDVESDHIEEAEKMVRRLACTFNSIMLQFDLLKDICLSKMKNSSAWQEEKTNMRNEGIDSDLLNKSINGMKVSK